MIAERFSQNRYSLDVGEGAEAFSTGYPALIPKFDDRRLIMPVQTHTCNVAIATSDQETFPETDGLVTVSRDIAIGIRTADCVPIVLNAPNAGVIAAVHAGWKGTIGGIVENAVRIMMELGAHADEIHAAMGPCICGKCYEVSEELAERFNKEGFRESVVSYRHIDLPDVNRLRLIKMGVPPANIRMPHYCTLENHTLFPSWRHTPGLSDRLITAISLEEL